MARTGRVRLQVPEHGPPRPRRQLTSRSYEDKDGNRRKAVEITVDSVHFCDSKKDGGQSSGSDFADPGYSEGSGDFTEIEDNGDLPF